MIRDVTDKYLPPDREAFAAADPSTGRVIVIAPTRAACETIEIALGLHLDTYLERTRGQEVRDLAASGRGFGIMAGTGSGKTLAIRPIAETILGTTALKVGVVNREREATPETPTWNVIVVTTGIARRWFQDGDIQRHDTLVVDEIHQTSAELELCLSLGKRVGCRFIWLSATVDPTFYARYLDSEKVLEVYVFDAEKAADVKVVRKQPLEFLDEKFLQDAQKRRRGVGMFLPTRAGVEQAAALVGARFPRINAAYYHGGEPIRVIRPFLEGEEQKPYFLAMTAAGQSALNVQGLDTIVIDDTRFTNIIERGKNVLTRVHLGPNEILQMAGRVHGRVAGGRVFILSDRDIDFASLRAQVPEFQLAGDSERVALTCADLGVRADELDLPVALDRQSYRKAVALLEGRGIIEHGRLSKYGKAVEALPVERAWAELIVNADDEMIPFLAVMSAIESLHRMTREERDLDGLLVAGSDHLTAYNLYAEAFNTSGYVGEVYGLERQLFDAESVAKWAERRGVLVKAVEDAALAMASVYRSVGLPLPQKMTYAREHVHRKFADLLARFMPFDLVIDEETVDGQEARVSKTSVCGSWGPIAGELRYFADRQGIPRASIEGTQVAPELLRKYATRSEPELIYEPARKHAPLAIRRRVEYFGFELEREVEALDGFTEELAPKARRVLAEAMARFDARHVAVKRNRPAIEEIRELHRRSGGISPRLGFEDLTAYYESQLADVQSLEDFRAAPLRLSSEQFIPREERQRLWELPSQVRVRDREVEIDYDIEEDRATGTRTGVARLRLPEKLARTMTPNEVPRLDRPVRFTVLRGQRGAVRASTIEELQELLDRPWSPDETSPRAAVESAQGAGAPQAERDVRRLAGEFRRDKAPGRSGQKGRRNGSTTSTKRGPGERSARNGAGERGEGGARGERGARGQVGERGGEFRGGPGGIGARKKGPGGKRRGR